MISNEKFHIILPARIVEFFPSNQTATIQISAEYLFSNATEVSASNIRRPIEGVPVHTVSGGGWSMTMPIKAGDTGLMYFSQIGFDHWLFEDRDSAGTIANQPKPWLRRQFHEDDGLMLVGFNTLPRAIKKYSANHSQWRNEDAAQVISLNDDSSITITSPVSVTINAPSVTVNCETANISATSSTTIDTPDTAITGNLTVGGTIGVTGAATLESSLSVAGAISGAGGMAVSGGSGASVSGSINVTGGDLVVDGTSLLNHHHIDAEGRSTGGAQA